MLFQFFFNFINSSGSGMVALALSIIVATFFLEEVTTVVVGVLAADGIIPIPLALLSLYVGVMLGDLGFYWVGRLASTHERLAKHVSNGYIAPFRAWLKTHFIFAVFSARFIPGSRFPTYTASGFFRSSFSTFIGTAVAAAFVWITFLFFVSYWFGSATAEWLGPARWVIAALFLLALFLIGRHNILKYRAKQNDCEK